MRGALDGCFGENKGVFGVGACCKRMEKVLPLLWINLNYNTIWTQWQYLQ